MKDISEQDIIRIGWEILCHKYLYYKHNCSVIDDFEYDALERLYKKLSGKEVDVGFPNRPAAHLIEDSGFVNAVEYVEETLKERRKQINES